jgi:hypothetical protein
MKRCAHCRGRFGLIRYSAYRAFGSIIQFCCKKCERAYFDERRKEAHSSPPPSILLRADEVIE